MCSWSSARASFIPGFVEGMKGAKAGEERLVNAKFPEDYPSRQLAGKDAVFAVKVKEVAKAVRPEVNDEFAKTLGVDSLAKLRELVARQDRQRIRLRWPHEAQAADPRRARQGARLHSAGSLVTGEFEGSGSSSTQILKSDGKTIADAGKSEDELRPSTARSPSGACGWAW